MSSEVLSVPGLTPPASSTAGKSIQDRSNKDVCGASDRPYVGLSLLFGSGPMVESIHPSCMATRGGVSEVFGTHLADAQLSGDLSSVLRHDSNPLKEISIRVLDNSEEGRLRVEVGPRSRSISLAALEERLWQDPIQICILG
jgi:hypothetical protein